MSYEQAQAEMRNIQAKLTAGMVELRTDNPQALYRRLYNRARRRGWDWKFATTETSVIVTLRKESNGWKKR